MIALSCHIQCLGAGQVIVARLDIGITGFKCLIRIEINATNRVYKTFKALEIDPSVVINFDIVQILQCLDGAIDTISAAVGQFIQCSVAGRIGHKVIPGCVQKQNLLCLGIHHSKDIHVAEAYIQKVISCIRATDINDEGFCDDFLRRRGLLGSCRCVNA